jgi:hypothetical protein
MLDALASTDNYLNSALPFDMDVVFGHTKSKGSFHKHGSNKIDRDMKIARPAVTCAHDQSWTAIFNDKVATDVLKKVIILGCKGRYLVVILTEADLQYLCPTYSPMQKEETCMHSAFNAMIYYYTEMNNTCF